MFRKIINFIIAGVGGLIVTVGSSKVSIEGLRWLVPIKGGCGDHWGGLPFSYTYVYLNSKSPGGFIRAQCIGDSSILPMLIDWFLWSFVVFVLLKFLARVIKHQ